MSEEQKIDGSGKRLNAGKLQMDLVPPSAMRSLARVMGYGASKYSKWNWKKGMSHSVVYACLLRHIFAWYEGEDVDPESGLSHLDHVMANAAFLVEYNETFKQGDDRFKVKKD